MGSYQRLDRNAAVSHSGKSQNRIAGSFIWLRLPANPAGTAKLIDGTGAFIIDNAVAKALRDDYHRLGEAVRKKCGDPLSAAEVEEESNLRARVGNRARAIGCPAGYGLKQAQQDNNRLHQLYCKRISPPSCGGGALPDAEDTEEAQLTARVAAFEESPEGCARRRIRDLEMQNFRGGRSAAEQNELDNLKTLYPDLPLDPDDPFTDMQCLPATYVVRGSDIADTSQAHTSITSASAVRSWLLRSKPGIDHPVDLAHNGNSCCVICALRASSEARMPCGDRCAGAIGVGLLNPDNPSNRPDQKVEATARSLGIALSPLPVRLPNEFEGAFDKMQQDDVRAVVIEDDGLLNANVIAIATLATKRGLLSIGNKESRSGWRSDRIRGRFFYNISTRSSVRG